MPSVARSKKWYVRITAPWEFLRQKIETFKTWVDYVGYFAGYHIGEKTEKPHVHIALSLSSELQKQSLDKRLKDLFQVKGSDYSSKIWDEGEDALSYMYHDPKAEIDNQLGLPPAAIERIMARNIQVQKIVAEAKEKASCKVVEYVLIQIRASGTFWQLHQIAYAIWQGVHSGQFYHPGPQYKRYIEEIYCKQSTSKEELDMTFRDVFKMMYRDYGENFSL